MGSRLLLAMALIAMSPAVTIPVAAAEPEGDVAHWAMVRELVFGDREIVDGAGVIELEAPVRAYDAAIVPVTIKALLPQTPERYIKTITLIVDKNPVPVAGIFHLTPDNGVATIATRIRVNEYTDVHAVAEANDGTLYQVSRFVKAAGGCSAPAMKDQDAAMARLGQMRLRHDDALLLDRPAQVQLLVSHPNYSGLQMNQLTRHYIPAHYVQTITVKYGGRTILAAEGDISLSENPSVHFYFVPDSAGEITVEVVDTKGNVFTGAWPVTPRPGS